MISKYSFGIGDRFGCQGEAQLRAFELAQKMGVEITPVWNKSNREHQTVHSQPNSVRQEADQAVIAKSWEGHYLVDADHINMSNVDPFIEFSDFFTIDVAEYISIKADETDVIKFNLFIAKYVGHLKIPGIQEEFVVTDNLIKSITDTFLYATKKASEIYEYIKARKSDTAFVTEVSMDEVENPQTPLELFFILAALAFYEIPVQTIAPKFTGRFNKGVDYEGDIKQFEKEFEENLLVINYAVDKFKLPEDLKLSVHTGSDKFSLYPIINKLIKKYNTGLHLKTAGTTWLEELIGLSESAGAGLQFAKSIYMGSLLRYEELTGAYSSVLNIDKAKLPSAAEVKLWDGEKFSTALRHDQQHENFNPHFRQLLHTSYKLAYENQEDFYRLLHQHKVAIAKNVSENIFERHIKPLFLD